MKLFDSYINAFSKIRPKTILIGNFDGVHKGHQALIKAAISCGGPVLAITFSPHPLTFFNPLSPVPLITSENDKFDLILKNGIDGLCAIPFDRRFAALSPVEFISILTSCETLRFLVIGEDFHFSKGREGNVKKLAELFDTEERKTINIPTVIFEDSPISSSRIRDLLKHGDINESNKMLGRNHYISGIVQKGLGIGNSLGFPTANISPLQITPGEGVYAGIAEIDNTQYLTAVSIGKRATIINSSEGIAPDKLAVEAHLLKFKGNLYGKKIKIFFIEKMRNQKKFDSTKELHDSIEKDIFLIEEQFRGYNIG